MVYTPGRASNIVIVFILLLLYSSFYAQETDHKIYFNFKGELLKDALEFIIKEYEAPIAYQNHQIKELRISATCQACDLESALNNILKGTPLSFSKVGSRYIISQKQEIKSTGRNIINGFLRDKATGEPIPYGNVWLQHTPLGAASDVHGYYLINGIPSGEYILIVSIVGYEQITQNITVHADEKRRMDFDIIPQSIEGEAIQVTAEKARFKNEVETSRIQISPKEINSAPSFIEADVFRTIQQLPGVTSPNDFSSALIVRGGGPDENLILLDGAEIYNPYHLGGLFSTFNVNAISDAEFFVGGYPAEYTGKLSSILNITSREGNSRQGKFFKDSKFGKFWDLSRIQAEISLLSSRATAEGPSYHGAWILSARRTYFDLIADLARRGEDWAYYFWDFQFKIFSDINDQNRLTFSTFNGRDVLEFVNNEQDFNPNIDFGWRWGNNSLSLNWRYIPSSRFFSEFILTRSGFDFDLDLDYVEIDSSGRRYAANFTAVNRIQDFSLTEKLTWFISSQHTVLMGVSLKKLALEFNFDVDNINFYDIKQTPVIFSTYLQDNWKVTDRFSIQPGVRISKYELHIPWYFDPRFAVKYMLTENLSLKGSWGIFHQFLFTTNDQDMILQVVDFWQPVPENFDAINNQHFIVGMEKWFHQGITGSIELYYKPYRVVLDNNPNNDPGMENDEFISGRGRVWGLELLFKKTTGKITGWLGYSFTDIEKRFDFNSNGTVQITDNEMSEIFSPKYSKPHSFNLVVNYQLNKKNQFSLSLTMASGQPYTPVVGKVHDGGETLDDPYSELINIYGRKNSFRYPFYLRGDLAWIRDIFLFGNKGKFKVQVINFTNHFNVLIYIWDHYSSPSKVKAISMFPILPSIGLEFEL